MKKNIVLLTLLTFYFFNGYGQLFTLPFTGAATCPTPGSTLSPQPPNVTIGTVTRYGTLTCNATADFYNTANWTTLTTINTTQYVEFTVTAATGYQVNFASLNFIIQRSSTGPVNGRIAHDGGTGTFSSTYDFTATTSNTTVGWDFTDFTAPATSTVKFRIYGWGASGSTGTLRLDDLSLDATVNIIGGNLNWLLAGNAGLTGLNFLGSINNASLRLRTNNIQRIVLDSLGNFGIGVAAPTAQLHNNGTVRLAGLVSNDTASRILVSDTLGNLSYRSASSINNGWGLTGNAGLTGLNFLGSINNASLRLRTNNIQRIVLDSLGNFGIGVASPTAQLHNNGSVRLAGLALNDTASRILVSDTLGNLSYRSASSFNNGWGLTGNAGLTGLNFLGSINNASLRLRTNNIQRIVLDSLGNFGIGVVSPTAKLHNNGSVRLAGLALNDTASRILVSDTLGNLSYRSASSINNGWGLTGNAGLSGLNFLGSINNASLRLRTNNIQRIVLDSLGNFGIGVADPTAQLHNNGTVRLAGLVSNDTASRILVSDTLGNLSYRSANSINNGWGLTGNAGLTGLNFLGSINNASLRLRTNNIQRIVLDSLGNFGIGIASPTAQLHNNGSVRLAGLSSNDTASRILVSDTLGNLSYRSASSINNGWGLTGNAGLTGLNFLGSINNASLRLRTNNIQRVVLDSLGNFGIGIAAPTAQLHANGDIRFEKYKNNISADSILTTDENGNLKLKFFNVATATTDTKWTLKKGNIYSMDMANVGIGVDSATAKFHTNGTVRMEQFKNNPQGDSILTTDANGNLMMIYRPYIPGGGGGGALYNFGNGVEQANGNVSFGGQLEKDVKLDLFNYSFSLNNGLNGVDKVFTVSPDGNTGIGGSSIAGYKLAVSGNATIGNKKDEIGDGAKLWFNADGNSSNMWIGRKNVAIGNTELRINIGKETNTDNRFAVGYENGSVWKPSFIAQANGKAGVGTEDIVSNMSLGTGHGDKVGVGNKLWGSTSIITTGSATSTDYTDLMVPGQNHNNALLRLNSAGNVGIGTFNIDPEYRLSVNGKIRSKGLRVQTDNWADFVFEKNYVLKSLPDLEKFIKANKHLPEMPSEAEVIKEGNDVGETQIKLLQKVEELTLYLIDQNKKIDALVEKNKELEKKSKDIEALKKEIQGLKKVNAGKKR